MFGRFLYPVSGFTLNAVMIFKILGKVCLYITKKELTNLWMCCFGFRKLNAEIFWDFFFHCIRKSCSPHYIHVLTI